MKTLYVITVFILILFSNVSSFFIQDSKYTPTQSLKDPQSLRQYSNPRQYLLEFLKRLRSTIESNEQFKEEMQRLSSSDRLSHRTIGDGDTRSLDTEKRGREIFGIMPPMREMCRLMGIRYCRGHS